MTNLTKIDSLEAFNASNLHGYYFDRSVFNYIMSYPAAKPVGLKDEDVEVFNEGYFGDFPNAVNYWVYREMIRLTRGDYRVCGWAARLGEILRRHSYEQYAVFVSHIVHQPTDETKDGMLAYTPSHEYGKRDRQVRLSLGRYITKHFADVLGESVIREFVNGETNIEIKYAVTREEIKQVYTDGPPSCMAGEQSLRDIDGQYWHPAEVYAQPDGTKVEDAELAVAYMMAGETIIARALVSPKHKVFVRCYGDIADRLQARLQLENYSHVSTMGGYGITLMKVQYCNGGYIMPYLDGCGGLNDVGDRFKWIDDNTRYSFDGGDANGVMCGEVEDTYTCDRCGDEYPEDSDEWNSDDYHEEHICSCCANNYYTYAIYNRYGHETYIPCDETIEVDGQYYLDDSDVLAGNNCVQLWDDTWAGGSEDYVTLCEESSYAGAYAYDHDCTLVGDDWYLDGEDNDAIEAAREALEAEDAE
jgi:hypothetical protein